jgi:hypothetical protein
MRETRLFRKVAISSGAASFPACRTTYARGCSSFPLPDMSGLENHGKGDAKHILWNAYHCDVRNSWMFDQQAL